MHESITESMNEQPELEGIAAWMDDKLADTAAEWTEVPETQELDGLPASSSSGSPQEIVQKSFQEMRDLGASLEEPDPDFTRSGLVFAVGPDGTSEMVAPEVKALYEQQGAACVGLSETQLCEMRLAGGTAPSVPDSSPAAPHRLAPMVSAPVLPEATAGATVPAAVPSANAATAPAAQASDVDKTHRRVRFVDSRHEFAYDE